MQTRENDSKDFYDREGIEGSVFDADWKRCCEKQRFTKLVAKYRGGDELLMVLRERYPTVLRVFDYYAMIGAGDIFSMQQNSWGDLMVNTYVAHEDSSSCKVSDCDRVFTAANYEEEKETEASALNMDNALMREEVSRPAAAECSPSVDVGNYDPSVRPSPPPSPPIQFLECLVRIAIMKFLEVRPEKKGKKGGGGAKKKGGKKKDAAATDDAGVAEDTTTQELEAQMEALGPCRDVADAMRRLLDAFIFPHVPPEAKVDSGEFGACRLYFSQ